MKQSPVITLRNISMLLPFIADDTSRLQLTGFYMEPKSDGGCILVATDGHALLVIYDKKAIAPEPLIWRPSRTLIAASNSYAPEISDNGDIEIPDDGEMVVLTEPTMGEQLSSVLAFPDWRHILSDVDDETKIIFNPAIMAKFQRPAAVFGRQVTASMGTKSSSGLAPWFMSFRGDTCFGAVVGMRSTSDTKFKTPEWALAPKSP